MFGLGSVNGHARDGDGYQTDDLDAGDHVVGRSAVPATATAVRLALHHVRERVADGDDHAGHGVQVGHGRVGRRAHDPPVVGERDVAYAAGTAKSDDQVVLGPVTAVQVAAVYGHRAAVCGEVQQDRVRVQAVTVRVPGRRQVHLPILGVLDAQPVLQGRGRVHVAIRELGRSAHGQRVVDQPATGVVQPFTVVYVQHGVPQTGEVTASQLDRRAARSNALERLVGVQGRHGRVREHHRPVADVLAQLAVEHDVDAGRGGTGHGGRPGDAQQLVGEQGDRLTGGVVADGHAERGARVQEPAADAQHGATGRGPAPGAHVGDDGIDEPYDQRGRDGHLWRVAGVLQPDGALVVAVAVRGGGRHHGARDGRQSRVFRQLPHLRFGTLAAGHRHRHLLVLGHYVMVDHGEPDGGAAQPRGRHRVHGPDLGVRALQPHAATVRVVHHRRVVTDVPLGVILVPAHAPVFRRTPFVVVLVTVLVPRASHALVVPGGAVATVVVVHEVVVRIVVVPQYDAVVDGDVIVVDHQRFEPLVSLRGQPLRVALDLVVQHVPREPLVVQMARDLPVL